MPRSKRTLWIDTAGLPAITYTANGEENALRWGWVRAEAVPMLDPEPWHCPGADPKYRIKHGEQLQCDEFTPRPGYSQNQEDYA